MKTFSLSTIVLPLLAVFVSNSLQQDQELDKKVYGYCKQRFQPLPAICNKFEFMSSEQAVTKGCVVPKNGTTFYDLSGLPEVTSIDPRTAKMASLITNVFEDGDSNFAYASCLNIQDLRGFTSGYAGFTTGTGDSETLIDQYTKKNPKNQLMQYLPRIHEISQLPHCDRQSRGSTDGLGSFCAAWKAESCDTSGAFAEMQRQWVYENYMLPSARYAAQNGVESALGKAIFYDTVIQHGFQFVEPDINIVRILVLTGPRMRQESEQDFLKRFLVTRQELQCCYPDKVWPASAIRSMDLQTLVDDFEKNKDLQGTIELQRFGRRITGDEDVSKDVKHC